MVARSTPPVTTQGTDTSSRGPPLAVTRGQARLRLLPGRLLFLQLHGHALEPLALGAGAGREQGPEGERAAQLAERGAGRVHQARRFHERLLDRVQPAPHPLFTSRALQPPPRAGPERPHPLERRDPASRWRWSERNLPAPVHAWLTARGLEQAQQILAQQLQRAALPGPPSQGGHRGARREVGLPQPGEGLRAQEHEPGGQLRARGAGHEPRTHRPLAQRRLLGGEHQPRGLRVCLQPERELPQTGGPRLREPGQLRRGEQEDEAAAGRLHEVPGRGERAAHAQVVEALARQEALQRRLARVAVERELERRRVLPLQGGASLARVELGEEAAQLRLQLGPALLGPGEQPLAALAAVAVDGRGDVGTPEAGPGAGEPEAPVLEGAQRRVVQPQVPEHAHAEEGHRQERILVQLQVGVEARRHGASTHGAEVAHRSVRERGLRVLGERALEMLEGTGPDGVKPVAHRTSRPRLPDACWERRSRADWDSRYRQHPVAYRRAGDGR